MAKKKILIVDDEKDTCDAIEGIMADEGYEAFSAFTGESALSIARKKRPNLILLDIKMPEMDGIEFLRRVKEIDKNVVVVMITGYGALDTAKEAMRLGAYDYVTKPFDMNFIKAVARDVLSEKKTRKVAKKKSRG